jgi:hypothetical protein
MFDSSCILERADVRAGLIQFYALFQHVSQTTMPQLGTDLLYEFMHDSALLFAASRF